MVGMMMSVFSYSSAQDIVDIRLQEDTVVLDPIQEDTMAIALHEDVGNAIAETDTEQTENAISALNSRIDELTQRQTQLEQENQWEKVWKRKKYWKIGVAFPDVERTDGTSMEWKTDFSVFMQRGKSAYLHSKPIAGIMKFAIDFGFVDLTYSKLKFDTPKLQGNGSQTGNTGNSGSGNGFDDIESGSPDGSILDMAGIKLGMHKIDYALHVGPSLSINPVDYLIVHTYFHVKPIASGIIENDKFSYGFGVATEAGLSLSYKTISLGAEWNWSKLEYKQASFDEDEGDEEDGGSIFSTEKFKLKNVCPRVYIAFRF